MESGGGGPGDVSSARVVLSTGSVYNLALDRAFELASGCGYDGVEVLVDARPDTYDVRYLGRLTKRWRIPILALHTPFAPRVDGWARSSEKRVEQAVRLAQELGAAIVVAHAPLRWHIARVHLYTTLGQRSLQAIIPVPNRAEGRYASWLREGLPELEERSGVRVALENMPAGRMLGRRVRHYRLTTVADCQCWPRLVLDTTHWGTWGIEPADVFEQLAERVVHVHLSDYDGREHRVPFTGRLKLERLLASLRSWGYGGLVSVELEPGAIAGGSWRRAR
ncbi:MAG: TIM barrel protein, partial [Anaerolineae bacterium]|nr:TIM barrel protein [Anaerolineae bacterium]